MLSARLSSFKERIGKTQGIALSTIPPRKASSSACHQARPLSAGAAGTGLALISKARSAPSSPRSDSTPSRVAGAAVPSEAFGKTISRPSPRRLDAIGSAAASISDCLIGKNSAVGLRRPPRALAGTSSRKSCAADAKRVSNGAGIGSCRRAAAKSGRYGRIGRGGLRRDRQVQAIIWHCPGCRYRRRQARRLPLRARRFGPAASSFGAAIGTRRSSRSGIAVIADAVLHEVLGHRPEDVPRREPGRQVPVDRCRQPGIAGVLPIDMPARLDLEVKIDPERRRPARSRRFPRRARPGPDPVVREARPPARSRPRATPPGRRAPISAEGRRNSHPRSAPIRCARRKYSRTNRRDPNALPAALRQRERW